MQVQNNYSPSFSGIHIKTSAMNNVQQNLSRRIADMLDYTDEYVKAADTVDVYFLPGKSEKSVVVKFMDSFSDMFFRKGKDPVKTSIHSERSNYTTAVDDIRAKLKDIDTGKIDTPIYDEQRLLDGTTDLAKLDPDVYAELTDDVVELKSTLGQESAESIALDIYQRAKKLFSDPEF